MRGGGREILILLNEARGVPWRGSMAPSASVGSAAEKRDTLRHLARTKRGTSSEA